MNLRSLFGYLPGYNESRDRLARAAESSSAEIPLTWQGETVANVPVGSREGWRQMFIDALTFGPMGMGAGPKPGPYRTAATLEARPQADPAITGGSSPYDPVIARNSSHDLARRPGFEDINRFREPARREARPTANDNTAGPIPVKDQPAPAAQTKGGDIQRSVPGLSMQEVETILTRLNIPISRVQTAGTGSRYVHIKDPAGGPDVVIRVSDHMGHPDRARNIGAGNFFETAGGKEAPGRLRYRGGTVINEGGERFGTPEALEAALRWRFPNQALSAGESFLVRPDQAPRGTLFRDRSADAPEAQPQGPDNSPDQPRLLATSAPAGAALWQAGRERFVDESQDNPWQTFATAEHAGRFATPAIDNPDAALVRNTSELRGRVSQAADEIESMTRKSQDRVPASWDDFERAG